MNRVEYDICNFCGEGREDLQHLFWDCRVVTNFWLAFTVWWSVKSRSRISFTFTDIIFGYNTTGCPVLLNYCILYAKYIICRFILKENLPTFDGFLQYLRYECETEKYIAKNKQRNLHSLIIDGRNLLPVSTKQLSSTLTIAMAILFSFLFFIFPL